MKLEIEGLSREEARKLLIKTSIENRGEWFLVEYLSDGREIHVSMDGRKTSKENDKEYKGWDFKLHIQPDDRSINYIDDYFLDLILKRQYNPDIVEPLLDALKMSIELVPYDEIYQKYPELASGSTQDLPGESIEFLLKLIRWLGAEEDVNYWGEKPSGAGRFEGREKPINALNDYFRKDNRLKTVIKMHQLFR